MRAARAASACGSFIDHPDGVDLALCERVTKHLRDLLVDYGLEVSSPGPRAAADQAGPLPPLPRQAGARAPARAAGRPQELHRGARRRQSDDEVTVAADTGVVSIPYSEINRSNLLEGER